GAMFPVLAGIRAANDTGVRTYALPISNAATDTYAGIIQGTGGVTLTAGTETLTGANTYSGATTINGGTLKLSLGGDISASSKVEIGRASGRERMEGQMGGATIKKLDGS